MLVWDWILKPFYLKKLHMEDMCQALPILFLVSYLRALIISGTCFPSFILPSLPIRRQSNCTEKVLGFIHNGANLIFQGGFLSSHRGVMHVLIFTMNQMGTPVLVYWKF